MKIFDAWQATHDDAVARIQQCLEPSQYEPQIHGLVQWMLTTESNSYAYLPHEWAGAINSAEAFANLVDHIHHAVYDDGDLCFVTVNGEPRIAFVNPHEDNFRDQVITKNDRALAERRALIDRDSDIVLEVLTITPNQFGEIQEAWEIERSKKSFAWEAAHSGLDRAIATATRFKRYSPDWLVECAEQIEQYQQLIKSWSNNDA